MEADGRGHFSARSSRTALSTSFTSKGLGRQGRMLAALFGLCLLTSNPVALSAATIVPDGLSPGDTYHLAFVTSGVTTATSSDIADYNAFVNEQAALNPELAGITWYAIVSTETVGARSNTGIVAGVYRIDGSLVAESADTMFDATASSDAVRLTSPLNVNQFGESVNGDGFASVWSVGLESGRNPGNGACSWKCLRICLLRPGCPYERLLGMNRWLVSDR